MRVVSVIGLKNAGKTTLVVALAREFHRQKRRVGTIKHATHPALVDHEGTDSYRHFHEGLADRVMIAAPGLRVMFERTEEDTDPVTLARGHYRDADLVLVEGYRKAALPKVEVYRKEAGPRPIYDAGLPNAGDWIAIVTDSQQLHADCRVLRFQDTMWLSLLASLVWERARVIEE
jgi:molybdopterin-guanine dinucleotide biosynthesis protein B